MDTLIKILVGELIVAVALLIIILLLLIWLLLEKLVVGPKLTVGTDKAVYQREETVEISGTLTKNGVPMEGETVSISITTPEGDTISLPDVVTDAEGKYASSWVLPADAPLGSYTVTAVAVGVTATTTFTFSNSQIKKLVGKLELSSISIYK